MTDDDDNDDDDVDDVDDIQRRKRLFLFGGDEGQVEVKVLESVSGRPLGTVVWDGVSTFGFQFMIWL